MGANHHPLRIKIPATTTTAYYELDLAGNVRRLRASGGSDLGGYRYTAFGQTKEDTASVAQPLRWKGRWHATLNGGEIYDVRARQWAPEIGAFLSVDQFTYYDSKSTLWSWPNQNAIAYSDPFGKWRICVGIPGLWGGCSPPPSPPSHSCRNKRNICPKHPPNQCSDRNDGWDYGAGGGAKWRSPLGYECAYDKDGNLLPDKNGNYTYNYEPDPYTVEHIVKDVIPHFLFGGKDGYQSDLTTVEDCE